MENQAPIARLILTPVMRALGLLRTFRRVCRAPATLSSELTYLHQSFTKVLTYKRTHLSTSVQKVSPSRRVCKKATCFPLCIFCCSGPSKKRKTAHSVIWLTLTLTSYITSPPEMCALGRWRAGSTPPRSKPPPNLRPSLHLHSCSPLRPWAPSQVCAILV